MKKKLKFNIFYKSDCEKLENLIVESIIYYLKNNDKELLS